MAAVTEQMGLELPRLEGTGARMKAEWQKQAASLEQRAIKAVYALALDFSATYLFAGIMFLLALGIELSPQDPVVMWLAQNTALTAVGWKYLFLACAVVIVTFRVRVNLWGLLLCLPLLALQWIILDYVRASGYGLFTTLLRLTYLVALIYLLLRGGAFDLVRRTNVQLALKVKELTKEEGDAGH